MGLACDEIAAYFSITMLLQGQTPQNHVRRKRQTAKQDDRLPPHDAAAEKAVLGSMLRDNGCVGAVRQIVRAEDFHSDANQKVFRAIVAQRDQDKPIDVVLLADHLKAKGQIDDIGYPYLGELLDAAPTAANVEHYAGIVRDKAVQRALVLAGNQIARDAQDGVAPTEALLDAAKKRICELGASAQTSSSQSFQWRPVDAAAFARTKYHRDWVIKPLIVAGQPLVIGGPRKSLKTSIEVDLSVSLASSTDFLGVFRVPNPLRVAFFSGESGEATIQETLARVCHERGMDPEILRDNLHFQFDLPRLSNPADMIELRKGLKEGGIQIVIIDPTYLCLLARQGLGGTQASNLFEMGPLYATVANVCLSAGATPILVCHTQRAAARSYEPLELDDLAYAGIAEFARQWLLVSRREKYQSGTGQHHLWLNVGGSAGHGGLWAIDIDEGVIDEHFEGRKWNVAVSTATEAQGAMKDDKRAAKRQKEVEQDLEDDNALFNALDRLDREGKGCGFNKAKAEARLSNDRMARSVNRLKMGKAIEELNVIVELGSGAERTAKGLRRVPDGDRFLPFSGR